MAGEMEKIFSLCARMHVLLWRETRRIVDVEWMTSNADYVKEILNISRATDHAELIELAQRIEELHPLLPRVKTPKIIHGDITSNEQGQESKYLFSLR